MPSTRKISTKEAVALFIADRKSRAYAKDTIRFYRDKLGLFRRWLEEQGTVELDGITAPLVRAYFAHLIDRGNSQGSQNAAGRGVKAFLRWCEAEELTTAHPLRNVVIPQPPKQVLPAFSIQDIRQLMAVAPDARARAMLCFLLDTGLRIGEFVALNGEDVDLSEGSVTVRKSKTGAGRTAFIGPVTRRALIAYYKEAGWAEGDTPIWRNERTEQRLTAQGVRLALAAMGRDAKVKKVTPHQFRRTFAIIGLRKGIDLHTLSRLMGHSGIAVLRQYLALDDSDLAEAHRKANIVGAFLK